MTTEVAELACQALASKSAGEGLEVHVQKKYVTKQPHGAVVVCISLHCSYNEPSLIRKDSLYKQSHVASSRGHSCTSMYKINTG